ncbi:putative ribosomal protein L24e [Helianthus anomalus]
MRLEKCWFCSSTVYPGHGIQFVRNDAKIFRFCRSKCHKNFKMKRNPRKVKWTKAYRRLHGKDMTQRNPRKVKWTKAYRRLHGKDMTQDATFEFERKRNRPERYDRNLTENTLKAIKVIDKVRSRRGEKHIQNRLKVRVSKDRKEAIKELDQQIHMVRALGATVKDASAKVPVKVQQESNENRMEE